MRNLFLASATLAISLSAAAEPNLEDAASSIYQLEKTHAFLTWTVRHNDISDYTVTFTDFDAILNFNADAPETSAIEVMINPTAVQTNYPDPVKKAEWEDEIATDARFLNAGDFPTITFRSTSATLDGEFDGTVTGDLTFLGVTHPVTLDVTYNGVANVPWFGQRDLIGFNASTTLKRSDWGMTSMAGVVSDEVVIEFSGEFLQVE
ncbi:MAG: YceI family protein [Alphaproteobacteria bacterium]|nr:YceI family protein [Alphaproteobacteria bacterium]